MKLKTKRDFYNLISHSLGNLARLPGIGIFFLKIHDYAFKIYYNLEKYQQKDPWLIHSDFQKKRFQTVVNFISDRRYQNCLDVGCSTGYLTEMIAPYCKKITGLDISSSAINQARKKYSKTKVNYVTGTIRTYRFESLYDLILLADMLYCLTENLLPKIYLGVIKNLCSHINNNGRILITSYMPYSPITKRFILGYSKNYPAIMSRFGFVIERKKIVSGYKNGEIFQDSIILYKKTK